MIANEPQTVSVITVCFNARDEIDATILSVLGQTYGRIEYIVIDGGSKDGTVERIKNYETRIAKWMSESDKGIYDAMDKGVRAATGEWIVFMNAGDRFHHPDSLTELMTSSREGLDILYGDHEVRYEDGWSRIQHCRSPESLWKGMICSHQAMVCKRTLLLDFPLRNSDPITADFEFTVRAYKSGRKFQQCKTVVASISAGGISDRARERVFCSYFQIASRNGFGFKAAPFYLAMSVRSFASRVVRRLLPARLWNRLAALKHAAMRVR